MLRWAPRRNTLHRFNAIKRSIPTRSASTKSKPNPASRPPPFSVPVDDKSFNLPIRLAIYVGALMLSGHIFVKHVYSCSPTYGVSMLPTISSFGDWAFISKYYRRGKQVTVGDVVSFHHPVHIGERAIKRVIGMEGDFVLMNTPEKSDAMIQVPQGHCWVVGDNLKHSRDSRHFGPLPMALIAGKVTGKLYWNGWSPKFEWLNHDLQPAYIEDNID